LWFYPDLKGEAPVVYLGDEGETNLLAASMQDFVCLLARGKNVNLTETDQDRNIENIWTTIYNWKIEDLAEAYQISTKKAQKDLNKHIAIFQKEVNANFTCRTEKELFANVKTHPDFVKWIDALREKHHNEILSETTTNDDPLYLDLSYKDLTEVPKSILDNLEITTLDLSHNKITKIPEFIKELKNLKALHLDHNQLTEIPEYLSVFKHLVELYLSGNNISEVPKFIENFKNLKRLYFSENKLKSIDLDFTKIKNLTHLTLYLNSNLEYINPSIFKLKHLIHVDYDETKLEKTLSELDFIAQSNSELILDDITEIEEGDLEKIEQVHKKRIELFPSWKTYYDYACFIQYHRKTNFEQAKELYKKSEELIGEIHLFERPEFYTNFAKLYYYHLKKDFDIAADLYKKAVTLAPENQYCLKMYASFAKYKLKDYKLADDLYKKLASINRFDTSHKEEYADFLQYTYKKPKKALQTYAQLLRMKPNNKKYLKKYAEILSFYLDKPKKAVKIFKKLLKEKKSEDNYFNYIATLQNLDTDKEVLRKVFEEGIKNHPKDKYINSEYVDFLLENKEEEKVETLIKEKSNKHFYFKYILHLLEEEKFDKAELFLAKALEKHPKSKYILEARLHFLIDQNKGNKVIIETAKTLLKLSKDKEQRKELEQIIASKEDIPEDLSEFDALIASQNGDINALLENAALAMSDNDFSKSVALLNAVEKIDAFQYDMLSIKMSLHEINKGEEKAKSFLKDKLKNSPKNLNVLLLLIGENIKIEKNEVVKNTRF